jgi:hypothetical protein
VSKLYNVEINDNNWKRIDVISIAIGSQIANHPNDPEDIYKVQSINDGYVNAIHSNGKVELKIFPEEDLINGKWWMKE